MTEETKELTERKVTNIQVGRSAGGGLVPVDLEQLWKLAGIMCRSGMMPKGLDTPEAVSVAIQMGLEVGLMPMQAVQNIAVINGRPSIWGDAGLALVEASGLLEDFDENISETSGSIVARCWAKRRNRPTPVERTFSMADAQRAGLWSKPGPWQQYPKRMLQMRARWWVLRDLFPDVLKGLSAREEVIDYVDMEQSVAGTYEATKTRAEALKERLQGDKTPEPDPKAAPPPEVSATGTVERPAPKFLSADTKALLEEMIENYGVGVEQITALFDKKHLGRLTEEEAQKAMAWIKDEYAVDKPQEPENFGLVPPPDEWHADRFFSDKCKVLGFDIDTAKRARQGVRNYFGAQGIYDPAIINEALREWDKSGELDDFLRNMAK